jgi:hypothetical protein
MARAEPRAPVGDGRQAELGARTVQLSAVGRVEAERRGEDRHVVRGDDHRRVRDAEGVHDHLRDEVQGCPGDEDGVRGVGVREDGAEDEGRTVDEEARERLGAVGEAPFGGPLGVGLEVVNRGEAEPRVPRPLGERAAREQHHLVAA